MCERNCHAIFGELAEIAEAEDLEATESVRMGLCQPMNFCTPPSWRTVSTPGGGRGGRCC